MLAVLKASFDNVTGARNDCGLPDRVSATATFGGVVATSPCDAMSDKRNVVGFAEISTEVPGDTAAYMCPYENFLLDVAEADILISADVAWALDQDACRGRQEMLEATMTHEVAHPFGLGHVGEGRHGDATMSTRSNGPCHNEEASLGLGDILGLEELYAAP